MTPRALAVAAPAKLNLFLHVTGRRAAGYHTLESLFALIDLADTIELVDREDGTISRDIAVPGVSERDDLTLRAAHALREAVAENRGASIRVTKRIPSGAGLGGGSSDAASVLLGLNRLWSLGLSPVPLTRIGVRFGSAVPCSLGGCAAPPLALADVLTPRVLPPFWVPSPHPTRPVRPARAVRHPTET